MLDNSEGTSKDIFYYIVILKNGKRCTLSDHEDQNIKIVDGCVCYNAYTLLSEYVMQSKYS